MVDGVWYVRSRYLSLTTNYLSPLDSFREVPPRSSRLDTPRRIKLNLQTEQNIAPNGPALEKGMRLYFPTKIKIGGE